MVVISFGAVVVANHRTTMTALNLGQASELLLNITHTTLSRASARDEKPLRQDRSHKTWSRSRQDSVVREIRMRRSTMRGLEKLARSRCCNTRERKCEQTGNKNVDLNQRASS